MKMNPMKMNCPDIYYKEDYPLLYEEIENGRVITICVDNQFGTIVSPVIMREIPNCGAEKFYDLVTPYGYGGPVIISIKGEKSQLIRSFSEEMKRFVQENNIVSEFIRFHPIIGNGLDFKELYSVVFDRKTVGTNIRDFSIDDEFSKSARKNIKRALCDGVSWHVEYQPTELNDFIDIYYSTMKRNQAEEYYYFGDSYFEKCLQTLRENILYVKAQLHGKTIAAGLYFVCGEIVQCHLSGTLTEYLDYSPAYVVKYATAMWAKENGIHFIHYGGGTNNSVDNPLYLFKKKFGQKTEFDFYIGKKIWNKEKYDEFCRLTGNDENTSYFPAYRKV